MAKDDGRTITIYHSCDPTGAPILHHFKSGRYTLFHPQLDPHATAPLVRIPKRNGLTAQVRRCQRIGCEKCVQTDVVSDLTIEVAMAHGIRRAPLKPSAKAKTVYERLQDGQLRGQWIYGDPRPNELVKKVLYAPKYHHYSDPSGKVLRWLAGVHAASETASSRPAIHDLEGFTRRENSSPATVLARHRGQVRAAGAGPRVVKTLISLGIPVRAQATPLPRLASSSYLETSSPLLRSTPTLLMPPAYPAAGYPSVAPPQPDYGNVVHPGVQHPGLLMSRGAAVGTSPTSGLKRILNEVGQMAQERRKRPRLVQ
ncbi:hypothetical protein LTR53_010110 [Teratosphaeriaceae sp. CCFEE 6253]|nr:hypothetical protein LTR53_010110 [Teratosphaeriaceae sp. CCFEE 6253]